MQRAIEMGAELYSVFGHLTQVAEAEDLKPPRVGEQWARPAHELMQPAELADELVAGAQIQVIGISKNDLRAQLFQEMLGNGLDCSLGANRHEDGGLHRGVREDHAGAAGVPGGCLYLEVQGDQRLVYKRA